MFRPGWPCEKSCLGKMNEGVFPWKGSGSWIVGSTPAMMPSIVSSRETGLSVAPDAVVLASGVPMRQHWGLWDVLRVKENPPLNG